MHLHTPSPVDAPPEHASDRSSLRDLIGAELACLERGAELGDGVGTRWHFDEGASHWYEDSAVIAVGLKFFCKRIFDSNARRAISPNPQPMEIFMSIVPLWGG